MLPVVVAAVHAPALIRARHLGVGVHIPTRVLRRRGSNTLDDGVYPLLEGWLGVLDHKVSAAADGLVEQAIVPWRATMLTRNAVTHMVEVRQRTIGLELVEDVGHGHRSPDLELR